MQDIPKRIQKPIPLKINPVVQQVLLRNKNKPETDGIYSRSQSERSSNLNGEAQIDNTSYNKSTRGIKLPKRDQGSLNSINIPNNSGNISNYQNPSQASDQHIYISHKFSNQVAHQNQNLPTVQPVQEEQQFSRRRKPEHRIEQEFWLRLNVKNAYIPNGHVNWNTELRQAYIRISLLEQAGNEFRLMHKHNSLALSTIQHEYVTNVNSKTTQMSDKILPITSQPQELFPNSQFYEFFRGENALINAPDDNASIKERIGIDHFILNNDDFPIGNSAVCKFCGEKLIFNDSLTSVQEKAFILVEMVQLPNWSSGKEMILGWGVAKISEILKLENEYFELKLFKGVKNNDYDSVLNKMYKQRPINIDYDHIDTSDQKFLKQAFKTTKIYQPKQIGLLELKFKLLKDKDQITQERVVTKRPIYPYDVELGVANIAQTQKAETTNGGIIDFSKYDINVKKALDELYQQSQQFYDQNSRQTTFNTQHHSCSAFLSNCISQLAACPRGNVCLGAAAVLCDSEIYMLVLYNILNGQLLCPIGCHFGYVYKIIFSADGRYLLSCSADGRILVFDVSIFSFYGFNYYHGKPDQVSNDIAQVIAKKRSGVAKLTVQEEDVFNEFKEFLNEIQNQQDLLLNYQFGSIQNDIRAVDILSQISQECGGDLNKALSNISQTAIEQIYQSLLIHQIDQGLCIYDIVQLNTKLNMYIKPTGLLQYHDLNVPHQKFPINLKIISGNLSGHINFTLIQQKDVNKPLISNTQVLYSHNDYINVVIVQAMKQYSMIISGDCSGIVKFYSLQTQDNNEAEINLKFQAEIQTVKQLKDLALVKTKSKEIRLVALSSTFQVQIFDSAGNVISDVNDEVVKHNQNVPSDERVYLKVQELQLPGTARLCTDKQKQFCYVPGYGGAVFCVSPNGRIVQQFHIFEDNILYGCFINQLLYTPMGLLSAHTTIVEEAESILKDFVPHGTPKYSQLPIMLMRYSSSGISMQFINGTIRLSQLDQIIQQDDTYPITETPQYAAKEPIHTPGPVNEVYDEGPVEQMVNDFLKFIQLQRSGINTEHK